MSVHFQARTLENQIEIKLVALSKFGTTLGQAKTSRPPSALNRPVGTGDREPLLVSAKKYTFIPHNRAYFMPDLIYAMNIYTSLIMKIFILKCSDSQTF